MNKDEYAGIVERLRLLRQRLDARHIRENCPFKKGDKVIITKPNGDKRTAFVNEIHCMSDGDFRYSLKRQNMGGEVSRWDDYYFHTEKIEKA